MSFKNETNDKISDAYILVNGTVAITGTGADGASKRLDERNKGVIFKICAPFTDCISEINNTQEYNAKDLDVVIPMYSLIEYGENYSKTTGSLWQYYRDGPHNNLIESESFKSKMKITGKTPAAGDTQDLNIAVLLKYLITFWRALGMPLINCIINVILTGCADSVISFASGTTKFAITETKRCVPVVTFSTQDNAKLLQQLKSGFKRIINWKKYQ